MTLATPGAANSLSGNQTITVDGAAPVQGQVAAVVTTGGNVVANYWNNTNTGLSVTVPLPDDASLLSGGDVQLQAESNNTWRDLGAASNISAVNTDKVVTASASGTSDTDVEELGGGASVADNDVIEVRAVVSDASDNSTTWTKSATTLTSIKLIQ